MVTPYTSEAEEAAKSVLIELTHLFSAYRGNIVLVGDWCRNLGKHGYRSCLEPFENQGRGLQADRGVAHIP